MGSIHLNHIPDKDARVRAIQAFLGVPEMWTPANTQIVQTWTDDNPPSSSSRSLRETRIQPHFLWASFKVWRTIQSPMISRAAGANVSSIVAYSVRVPVLHV